MDTDLVEFQQLQKVEIFSYLCYSLDKNHVMVGDVLKLGLAMFSVSKHLNRVEKILIVVAVNSAYLRVSLFT